MEEQKHLDEIASLKTELFKVTKQRDEYIQKLESSLHTNSALKAENADYKIRLSAALKVIDDDFKKKMLDTYFSISELLHLIRTRGI